ncbi:MAG: hypothetical protein AAGB29_09580 [Planctomycetota bacterium]
MHAPLASAMLGIALVLAAPTSTHAEPTAPAPLAATTQPQALTLAAVEDFPDIEAGDAPYYVDKWRKALAINAGNANLRDKWAKATTAFDGTAGDYDVTLTTITEFDGECIYRVYVNDELVAEVQNPRVDKDLDMKPHAHALPKITLAPDDTIAVASICHSNDLIPEGDGYAWARGRWTTLELTPAAAE